MKLTAIIFLVSLAFYFLIARTRSKKQEDVKIKQGSKPEESKKVSVEKTKISWFWLFVKVVITGLILFGMYLFVMWYISPSKHIAQKQSSIQKPVSAPVYKWIFGFKAEPEDIINANGKGVDQICYRENDVVNKPYFDKNEIRFKYKTSKEKVIYAILDKKNPSESHFLGMVDLPDQTGKLKGRKLIIRLKETSMPDKFEGVIETWDGKNWYPQIPAFLKKVQVQ